MHQDWDEDMRFGVSSDEEMASDLESEADIISRDDSSCKVILTLGSSSYCIWYRPKILPYSWSRFYYGGV